jgi:Ala-tRNA(Pro) deacylase
MFISHTVARYLGDHDVDFDVVAHPRAVTSQRTAQAAHVGGECLAKAVILSDNDERHVMAIVPASRRVDAHAVEAALGHGALQLADEGDFPFLFRDCEIGALPALGQAFGLETVVEETLLDEADIYIEGGDHEHLLRLSGESFRRLMEDSATAPIACA